MNQNVVIKKAPAEQFYIDFDFRKKGIWEKWERIKEVIVGAINITIGGLDVTQDLFDSSKQVNKRRLIRVWVRDGVIGTDNHVYCHAIGTKGTVWELRATISVVEGE